MSGVEPAELLVAYDGSDAAVRAAEFAFSRAAKTGERVDVVHVGAGVDERSIRTELAEELVRESIVATVETIDPEDGDGTGDALAELIGRNGYEMTFVGYESYDLLGRLRHDSVTESLLERKLVPVTVVP